jgi:hypothetical protein
MNPIRAFVFALLCVFVVGCGAESPTRPTAADQVQAHCPDLIHAPGVETVFWDTSVGVCEAACARGYTACDGRCFVEEEFHTFAHCGRCGASCSGIEVCTLLPPVLSCCSPPYRLILPARWGCQSPTR